jgi:hypothetical protein
MLPCKGGEKGPELDTFEKSLDEVSFDDAFIEIKSRNMEFVTKSVRLNLRMVAKLQTDTGPRRHLSQTMPMTWRSTPLPKGKCGDLRSGGRWGSRQGGIAAL